MSNPKYVGEKDMIGRTVAKVLIEADECYLSFTDGTWTRIIPDTSGCYYQGDAPGICFDEPSYLYRETAKTLAKLGVTDPPTMTIHNPHPRSV